MKDTLNMAQNMEEVVSILQEMGALEVRFDSDCGGFLTFVFKNKRVMIDGSPCHSGDAYLGVITYLPFIEKVLKNEL